MSGQGPLLDPQHPAVLTTEQLSDFTSRQVARGTIDLAVGQPAPALLPRHVIQQAAAHRLSAEAQSELLLQYPPAQGYRGFRQALARFLSDRYGYEVHADELMATAGVSHGLDLCVRHLGAQPQAPTVMQPPMVQGEVFVECPTYFLAQCIFDQAQMRTHHVPTHPSEGLDLDALERLLQQRQQGDQEPGQALVRRRRLLYTIPVHNNPRGTTLSDGKRRQLIQLAHQHDLIIVADEVYQLLTFGGGGAGEVPRPLRWIERDLGLGLPGRSRVVSLSSFSKLTAPGLRIGWIEADPALLDLVKCDGATVSGGCMAALQTGIMHSALELGLVQSHLNEVVLPALEANCAALSQALQEELPALRWHRPTGGYFVFLELPKGVDARKLLPHAERHHSVRFTPGSMCGPGLQQHARLCFAFYTPAELALGVKRLAEALRTFQP